VETSFFWGEYTSLGRRPCSQSASVRQQAEWLYAGPVRPLVRGEKRTKSTSGVMCKLRFSRLDGVHMLDQVGDCFFQAAIERSDVIGIKIVIYMH